MAYRNVIISNPAKLSVKLNQLCISTSAINDTIPIEDINMLLIESQQVSVTTALLGELASSGVAVFICDKQHLPCAVITPYLQHSRYHEVTSRQLNMSLPTKKRLWQQIVKSKINNQAKCLELCEEEEVAKELYHIAKTVKPGDSEYAEGHCAAKYFRALFGVSHIRSNKDDNINAWLNYGYAILRGLVARSLTVYGFLPLFGIHHHSGLNQFNLADDFIEPFRPIVDLFVAMKTYETTELTPEIKKEIVNLINHNILVEGKKYSLSYAIELSVKSFSSFIMEKRKDLLLPELIPLEQHSYL